MSRLNCFFFRSVTSYLYTEFGGQNGVTARRDLRFFQPWKCCAAFSVAVPSALSDGALRV